VNWASHIDAATGRPDVATVARYRDTPWVGIPGGGGGHNWYPVAFSPKTGLIYIPATENSTRYNPTPRFEYVEGQPNIGVDLFGAQHGAEAAGKPTSTTARAYLLAWNPATQTPAWRVPGRGGGVLATAGDLVFQGRNRDGLLGELTAFRAEDGTQLWSHGTPDAILAGPITYRVGREQFVAVTSGASVMSFGAKGRMRHFGHLVAFKLGGTALLPPDPPLAARANPPAQHASPHDFAMGEERYGKYCSRCHGFETESPNVIPDLRRSAVLTQPETWQDIVIGGILADHGMIGWRRFLTAAEAETIRAYVGEKARTLADREQPSASP
jgi:quinohemoprotein ethanol dehydrogenase